ncbi:MAG: hypothetical protein AAF658_20040, partial [Myxococcota bacterium]
MCRRLFTVVSLLAAIGCTTSDELGATSDSTVLNLERDNATGSLLFCDSADPSAACAEIDNPDGCASAVVTIETATGRSCVECF